MLRFGMRVEIVAMSGTWSEVSRESEERVEVGNIEFQAWLIRTRSSRTRVGTALRLDQV
jgi:hypothetical protein